MESASSQMESPALAPRDSAWRGVLTGLVPLGLLAVFVALAIGLTALARQMTLSAGFFTEREAVIATLVVGLLVAAVVYGVACFRMLRRVGVWLRDGYPAMATGALWALGITALVVALPVILAIVVPQHPAP
jgi:hypothetical protein